MMIFAEDEHSTTWKYFLKSIPLTLPYNEQAELIPYEIRNFQFCFRHGMNVKWWRDVSFEMFIWLKKKGKCISVSWFCKVFIENSRLQWKQVPTRQRRNLCRRLKTKNQFSLSIMLHRKEMDGEKVANSLSQKFMCHIVVWSEQRNNFTRM